MKIRTAHPRLYFDANAEWASRSFALVRGTLDDLQALGLTPEQALGTRFTFVQEDVGVNGEPDALLFDGTIAYSEALGFFALADPGGVRWWSDMRDADA
ncbi:MAG: hypothetical protein BGP24_12740 [Lysobacterales bacterium 69-70]|nr:hypothetical protein [Xanthomonadaceae bacterium]ODU31058.1 MAG: hypothetical protein ABS97_22500 [Xanthomonadaceae bacterium SCN 69-320]ODV20779.1 MAG: hypothetical protein ABT27_06195 [Xanthomonadaceae bacterium SCN 69-25]OJY98646.1 MAG: hypothetical protein BGP24_12740 [Xanthomonadales bacterium 69-70]